MKGFLDMGMNAAIYNPTTPYGRTQAAYTTKGSRSGPTHEYEVAGVASDTSAIVLTGWHGFMTYSTTTPSASQRTQYRPDNKIDMAYWKVLEGLANGYASITVEKFYTVR